MYKSNQAFLITENLVYNLMQDGWYKGEPRMVNDVSVSIYRARHLSEEDVEDIANTIREALNAKYINI